jgi:hypothetical protein
MKATTLVAVTLATANISLRPLWKQRPFGSTAAEGRGMLEA